MRPLFGSVYTRSHALHGPGSLPRRSPLSRHIFHLSALPRGDGHGRLKRQWLHDVDDDTVSSLYRRGQPVLQGMGALNNKCHRRGCDRTGIPCNRRATACSLPWRAGESLPKEVRPIRSLSPLCLLVFIAPSLQQLYTLVIPLVTPTSRMRNPSLSSRATFQMSQLS